MPPSDAERSIRSVNKHCVSGFMHRVHLLLSLQRQPYGFLYYLLYLNSSALSRAA